MANNAPVLIQTDKKKIPKLNEIYYFSTSYIDNIHKLILYKKKSIETDDTISNNCAKIIYELLKKLSEKYNNEKVVDIQDIRKEQEPQSDELVTIFKDALKNTSIPKKVLPNVLTYLKQNINSSQPIAPAEKNIIKLLIDEVEKCYDYCETDNIYLNMSTKEFFKNIEAYLLKIFNMDDAKVREILVELLKTEEEAKKSTTLINESTNDKEGAVTAAKEEKAAEKEEAVVSKAKEEKEAVVSKATAKEAKAAKAAKAKEEKEEKAAVSKAINVAKEEIKVAKDAVSKANEEVKLVKETLEIINDNLVHRVNNIPDNIFKGANADILKNMKGGVERTGELAEKKLIIAIELKNEADTAVNIADNALKLANISDITKAMKTLKNHKYAIEEARIAAIFAFLKAEKAVNEVINVKKAINDRINELKKGEELNLTDKLLDNEDLKKFTEDLETLKNAKLQVFDRVNLPSQFFSSNHEQQVGKAIIKALEQRSKTNEALNEANEEVTLAQNTLNELNSKFLNKLDDANLEEANEANIHLKSVKNELIKEDTEINNANEKIKEALKSDKIDNVIKNAREAEEKASSALININKQIKKVRKEKKNILQIISNVKNSREIIKELRENITNFENKTKELFNPQQPPQQTKLPKTTPQVENLPTMDELLKSLQNKVSEKKSFLNVLGNKFSIFLRRQ